MVDQEKWYFTKEQLAKTPSIQCGIDADKEISYRQSAAKFIQDLGQRLSVSPLCINSATVYMHRFYMFHSVTQFHKNAIASAALFLSAKVGEQPRPLEQVINGSWMLLHGDHTPPQTTSTQYLELSEDLVLHENVLLKTLGFDLIVDHPHPYILRYSHLVKANKDHVKASYFMASNSLHLTTMCLLYKPTVVACFCIHITSEWSNWEIQQSTDGKPWFWHIDSSVTEQQLRQLTAEFLHIFDKCSTRLKQKITSKLGNQSSSVNKNSPYLPNDAHSRRKQSCTNDGSTFRSSSLFSSNDPKKPSVLSSSSSFRPLDDYHEKPEKKECERSEREKAGAVDIAPNTSTMSTVLPPQKPNRTHSHYAKQQASSSQPPSSSGNHPSGSGMKSKMHHDHRKAHNHSTPKPEALSLPSQRHSSSTSSTAQESDLSRMPCDHSEANRVNVARRTSINHHGSQSKKARITISAESKISVSSVEAALNIEKFYRIPEKHEKADRKSYHPRNKNVDHFGKDSMQKEYKKYQQQHHCSMSSIDATAHNPTKPTINTNIRDEPSSTIGRSGPSSVANKINYSEPMKSLEPEPIGRQTNLTNVLKISKHEDSLSVATPDSGFGTQPTTSFQDCLSPMKTTRRISALSQEPLVAMPSFLLGIPDFGAPETSSQQSRHRDELSSYKNLRALRYSQVEHRDGTSVPFATARRTTEEKRTFLNNHEASGSSTTTSAEATSRWRNFDNCKSKKKKKKDKKHKSEMQKNISNVTSQVQPRSQDKVSSQTLTGLAMKMPMKRLRETASHPIQGSLKMEIRTLGDDTSSSTTRSYASSSNRNSDRSRTGSDASTVTRSPTKKLRARN